MAVCRLMVIADAEGPKRGRSPVLDIGRRDFIALLGGAAAAWPPPTSGKNTAATIAAPIEIKTVVASGSSPPLIVAFQPAWQAAASSTAAKTNESMARRIPDCLRASLPDLHAACEQARTINPGTPLPPIPRLGALVLLWAGDLGAQCVLTYFRLRRRRCG
jgi:hypothetical protein